MKRFLTYLLAAFLLCSCSAARYASGPQSRDIEARTGHRGILRAVSYPSSEPKLSERRMVVYLPEEYDQDTLTRYPVLYLLHGARGNEVTWIDSADVCRRIDSLRLEGLVKDFILVMPNMNNYFGDRDYRNGHAVNATRSFWTLNGEAERYFLRDVVMRTDSLFRTVPQKEGRAIAGMSSGGLQALYLAAANPEVFDYVGLFSPYRYPTFATWGHRDIYGALWPRLEVQFSDPPELYAIYIGRADFLRAHVRSFERRMTRKGYRHRFTMSAGGHEWNNWTDYFTDFCTEVFSR